MVSRQEKESMRRFVTHRFEDSTRFNIIESALDHILVQKKPELVEGRQLPLVYVFLLNEKISGTNYSEMVHRCVAQDRRVANIFFKDGEMFHVRLADRAEIKGDDRSLKNYDHADRNKMISLRRLEKKMLIHQNDPSLVYFQPETERLPESIRGYKMRKVVLDYSHVTPEHRSFGFVENRVSIDYKIAEEEFTCTQGGIVFRPSGMINFLIVDNQ